MQRHFVLERLALKIVSLRTSTILDETNAPQVFIEMTFHQQHLHLSTQGLSANIRG